MNKIGFVGIGKMGMPIACNLLKNGYEVKLPAHMAGLAGCAPGHASDLNGEALQLFTKRGG